MKWRGRDVVLLPLRGLFVFFVGYPRLAPLGQAQGRLGAALFRRFAAFNLPAR